MDYRQALIRGRIKIINDNFNKLLHTDTNMYSIITILSRFSVSRMILVVNANRLGLFDDVSCYRKWLDIMSMCAIVAIILNSRQ